MNEQAAEEANACSSGASSKRRAGVLTIPFALRDGRLFEPLQVDNGLKCRCVCPGCGSPVIAKHAPSGKVRPHFAHEADAACLSGAETALHLAAKQLIEEHRELFLPGLDAVARGRIGWLQERVCLEPVAKAGRVGLETVQVEKRVGRTRPDLLVTTNGRPILVEIAVTHFVDAEKLAELVRLGLPAVEFDLSGLRHATFQEVMQRLFENSGYSAWLHHPSKASAQAVADGRLRALLGSDEEQWQRERAAQLAEGLEREEAKRAQKLQRLVEQKEEASRLRAVQLGDEVRAAAFKALSPDEQLAKVCRYLGVDRKALPDFVNMPVRSAGAIAAPPHVWQTALFAGLVHPAMQKGVLRIDADMTSEWMSLRFHAGARGNPAVPIWDYLAGLSEIGVLSRRRRQEFLVTVAGWHMATQLAAESKAPGKRFQVWAEAWPDAKQTMHLARAFGEVHGNSGLWERVALLLPSVREREAPIQTSLHYTATLGANPDLLRRYFLSVGFTKLG